MRQFDVTLTRTSKPSSLLWLQTWQGEHVPQSLTPGRFFLAQINHPTAAYLRRAIFPHITANGLQLALTVDALNDPGFAWLASRAVGETLNLIGPLGHGFDLPRNSRNILAIAQSGPLGPLLGLVEEAIAAGKNVTLLQAAPSKATLYPAGAIPAAVEVRVVTLDGSAGHKGHVDDHLASLPAWADAIAVVGSLAFYQRLQQRIQQNHPLMAEDQVQVLLHTAPLHTCGVGICTYCTIPTTQGLRLACTTGPVFDLNALSTENLKDA